MTGYRHAVTLLLANGLKNLPPGATPELLEEALTRLARDLVALGNDMRVLTEETDWTTREFSSVIDRARTMFGDHAGSGFNDVLDRARTRGIDILAQIGKRRAPDAERDVFLLHAPEDRLPVAAPLGVELTKRGFGVAFSDYEVETEAEMLERHARGLEHHLAGLLLNTPAISRRGWALPPITDRFRIAAPGTSEAAVDHICAWLRGVRKHRKDSQIHSSNL